MDESGVFQVNIVTPDGQVYSQQSRRLVARATDGDLGILANHLPIIATLQIAERAEKRIEKAKQTHDVDDRRRGEVALARAINRIRVSEHH